MLTDDEIIKKSNELTREMVANTIMVGKEGETLEQHLIRLARWAESKGKEELQSEIDRLAPIGMEAVKEEIEQARASCLNECAGCHEKKFATIPFCQRCIVKKEASIRASAFQEGISAVEKELNTVASCDFAGKYIERGLVKEALAAARNAARKKVKE